MAWFYGRLDHLRKKKQKETTKLHFKKKHGLGRRLKNRRTLQPRSESRLGHAKARPCESSAFHDALKKDRTWHGSMEDSTISRRRNKKKPQSCISRRSKTTGGALKTDERSTTSCVKRLMMTSSSNSWKNHLRNTRNVSIKKTYLSRRRRSY